MTVLLVFGLFVTCCVIAVSLGFRFGRLFEKLSSLFRAGD